jgi:hypothetical protein
MNLVAKNDANKIVALVDDPLFRVLFRRVFSKVKGFWNKIGRSVVIADEVSAILGKYNILNRFLFKILDKVLISSGRHLPTPNETRWNAAFDCLEVFMSQDLANLNKALIICGIRALIPSEFSFLKEYLLVMKPVSITLECFQAEHNCYLGMVLPALVKLKRRLNELTDLHSFSEYRDLLVEQISLRFGHLFKDDTHVLASATHPQFKLNWIEDEFTKLEVKKKLDNLVTADGKAPKLISPVETADF